MKKLLPRGGNPTPGLPPFGRDRLSPRGRGAAMYTVDYTINIEFGIKKAVDATAPLTLGEGPGVGLMRRSQICLHLLVDFDPIKNISTNVWVIGSPWREGKGVRLKTTSLLLCLLFLFQSCKKDLPPPVAEDPVFQVDYKLNNQLASHTAGLNDVYLFTNTEKGSDEVWQFSGSFADATCPAADCPGTLTFILRNYTQEAVFDSTWNPGLFPMYQPSTFDSLVFQATLSYPAGDSVSSEVYWVLDNQTGLDGSSVVYETKNLTMDVRQFAQFSNGLSVQTQQLLFTAENQFCQRTAMQTERDSSGLITLKALPEPASGNYQFAWSTGDTASSFQTDWLAGATYTVTVSKIGGGCTATVSMGNLPDSALVYNSGLVEANVIPVDAKPIGPIIEWIDELGLHWRSDWGLQPFPANYFELLEVLDYDKNENGLPTKKLRIRWNCRMYNDAGESIPMEGSGVVAVGWPG
ncbi:MAG: hypothetical protein H6574_11540 [Lewinellaceae bacterium]|nr:hypothetical protein [Saprospiraceae bacterium]MCB9331708.1 hypothetical protein [Lewinellaceae bacterium]